MPEKIVTGKPGISREQRISEEGLLRLEKQLRSGVNISDQVLAQWVKRYGDEARNLILRYRANNAILPD